MGRTNKPAQRTLLSVDKALALLWSFEGTQVELGVVELSKRTGINTSTVSRLLGSLVAGRLVEYNEDTGRYRLGLGLVRLASVVTGRLDLRVTARPHLETLVESTHETASLSIFGGEQAVTVDFVPSPRSVASVVQLGRPSLVHCTSVGKLLLAFQPEEREPELNAVAAPVYGAQGQVVAALGLQGPAHRFDRAAMLRALPLVRKEALALSRALGAPLGGELTA